jgi:hypothetical protein
MVDQTQDMTGKVAVVTGATSGIGRVTACRETDSSCPSRSTIWDIFSSPSF